MSEYKTVQVTLSVLAPKSAKKEEITQLIIGVVNSARDEIENSKDEVFPWEVVFAENVLNASPSECGSCQKTSQELFLAQEAKKHLAHLVAARRRCLIIVSGGVADYVCDDGVDVEIFDWDNYKSDPIGTALPPEHYRDLAKVAEIPVKQGKENS